MIENHSPRVATISWTKPSGCDSPRAGIGAIVNRRDAALVEAPKIGVRRASGSRAAAGGPPGQLPISTRLASADGPVVTVRRFLATQRVHSGAQVRWATRMPVPQPHATAPRWLTLAAAALATAVAATGLPFSVAAASSGVNQNAVVLPQRVKLRTSATTPKPPELVTGPQSSGRSTTTYSVRLGDCLSDIAASHNIADWQQLYAANRRGISNPDLIYPGQLLRLPTIRIPQ